MNDASPFFVLEPHILRQRQRTVEVLDPWGLKAVYGQPRSKRPVEKITDVNLAKVSPTDWLDKTSNYNLLGILPRDMVDLDLDVRIKSDLNSRAPDWSQEEKNEAERGIFSVFRDALKETLGAFDFRALFGRDGLDGNGHLLLRIEQGEDLTLEERRTRLAQLAFTLDLGHFTVKLEVLQPFRKKGAQETKRLCFLPGSIYPEGDYCRFRTVPNGPVSMASNVLEAYPLDLVAKAIYRAALIMACRPLHGEGERHNLALLVSGVLRREVEQTERDGGSFTRDDASDIFEELFRGDPELKDRLGVFERDFASPDSTGMPGYPALGERIGPETANALRLMLHGRDMGMFDEMRANIIFVRMAGKCVDLSQKTVSGRAVAL